jgi:hypothetical protein
MSKLGLELAATTLTQRPSAMHQRPTAAIHSTGVSGRAA